MNKARAKRISKLQASLSEIKDELYEILSEEQDYFDNMPEAFQQGERGSIAESAISALNDAVEAVETAEGSLDEAAG